MEGRNQSNSIIPKNPVTADQCHADIGSSLSQICEKLRAKYNANVEFKVDQDRRKIIITETYKAKSGEPQTRTTEYQYGYGAQVQLTALYSQYNNLFRLLELFKELKKFGYSATRYDQPLVGIAAAIDVTQCSTGEVFQVFMTDEEYGRYTNILERCKATRRLAEHASDAEKKGVKIEIDQDFFKMTQIATDDTITIPNYHSGFTPSHGKYPINARTVDMALEIIGIIPN